MSEEVAPVLVSDNPERPAGGADQRPVPLRVQGRHPVLSAGLEPPRGRRVVLVSSGLVCGRNSGFGAETEEVEHKEEVEPIGSDEELAQLQAEANVSGRLDRMVNTPGWKEIVFPMLDIRRQKATSRLINAESWEDCIRAQQEVRVIEGVFVTIENMIQTGRASGERLQKHREQEQKS